MAEVREFVIGFVGVIVGIAVAISIIPVINDVIATANLSGVQATMVGLVPLLIAVGVLLFAVRSLF